MTDKRSGILTAGGVLAIISGVIGIILGILFIANGEVIAEYLGLTQSFDDSVRVFSGIVSIVIGLVAVMGGGYALGKNNFLFTLLGGGVCGLLSSGLLGILALVFIAISRKEFNQKSSL